MVADELTELLDLESCHFSLARPEGPELRSDGRVDVDRHVWVGDEFALPLAGAVLAVTSGGDQLGWFSLVPGRPVGVPLEARRVAVALACQLANALARCAPGLNRPARSGASPDPSLSAYWRDAFAARSFRTALGRAGPVPPPDAVLPGRRQEQRRSR